MGEILEGNDFDRFNLMDKLVNELVQPVIQTSSLQHICATQKQLGSCYHAYLTDAQMFRPKCSREADALKSLIVIDPESNDSENYERF